MKTYTYTVFKALESGAKTPTELMEITGLSYPTIKSCIRLLRKRGVEIETVYSGRSSCLYRIINVSDEFWDKPINRTEYLLEYLKKHKTVKSNDREILKDTRVASVIKFLINEGHKFEVTTNPKDGRQRIYRLIDEDVEPNAEQLEIPETEKDEIVFDTSEIEVPYEIVRNKYEECWENLKAKLEADYQIITNYSGYTDTGARAIATILEYMNNIENQEDKHND